MPDELLAAIDVKLDTLEGRLRGDIHTGLDELRSELRGEIRTLDERVSDLDRHMHVLHEDTIANIKALAPDRKPR